jgi:hypothetical protein
VGRAAPAAIALRHRDLQALREHFRRAGNLTRLG